jgi:hypothetical protein
MAVRRQKNTERREKERNGQLEGRGRKKTEGGEKAERMRRRRDAKCGATAKS